MKPKRNLLLCSEVISVPHLCVLTDLCRAAGDQLHRDCGYRCVFV